MKKTALILIWLFAFLQNTHAQVLCEPVLPYKIKSSNGLKMREGPGVSFKVIVFIAGNEPILVCEEKSIEVEFEGIVGNWRRVKYKDKYGYLFDGFIIPLDSNALNEVEASATATALPKTPVMSKAEAEKAYVKNFMPAELAAINKIIQHDHLKLDSVLRLLNVVADYHGYEKLVGKPKSDVDSNFRSALVPVPVISDEKMMHAAKFQLLTETYNYCGDIRNIDPGKLWYSVYRDGPIFRIRRAELLIVKSKYSIGKGLEFDIRAEGETETAFLISSEKPLNLNWYVNLPEDHFAYNPQALMPGQKTEIYAVQSGESIYNVNLMALGNVVDFQICPVITDYKILAIGEKNDNLITQNLIPNFAYLGDCGIPEIYWFGDLNQDNYPDIIFAAVGEQGAYFILFMSDAENPKMMYRKADEWFNKSCD